MDLTEQSMAVLEYTAMAFMASLEYRRLQILPVPEFMAPVRAEQEQDLTPGISPEVKGFLLTDLFQSLAAQKQQLWPSRKVPNTESFIVRKPRKSGFPITALRI